jgi:hypothetical protein
MNAWSQRDPILWIFGFSLLASAAICLMGSFLLLRPGTRQRLVPHLISYAIGTLLGAAFPGLIPHALAYVPASNVFAVFLAGIVGFIVLERLMLWLPRDPRRGAFRSGVLILIGDGCTLADGIHCSHFSHVRSARDRDFLALFRTRAAGSGNILQRLPCARLCSKSRPGASTLSASHVRLVAAPALAVPYFMALAAAGFVCRDGGSGAGSHRCAGPVTGASQRI